MYILGISCYYHDSAAAILKDGIIIAAAEEERFTRKKHDTSFPLNAINYCLKEAGIMGKQLDHIAFYEKPILKFERLMAQHFQAWPKSFPSFHKAMPSWMVEKLRVPKTIAKKTGYKGDVLFIEHHLAHAASAFLPSPFEKAAILTVDGVGEWSTTTLGVGDGNDIHLTKEIKFPHSLGLLYSTVTAFLGFTVNNSEYKVMGLAPYGKPKHVDKFRKLIRIAKDGSYALDMSYFVYHYKMTMPGPKFIELFGKPRKPSDPMTHHYEDIASSLQVITEEIIFGLLNYLHQETKLDNLCMAGGVALNTVANGKILDKTPFKKIWIQPAASDAGTSLGAAIYTYNTILGKKRVYKQTHAYLGPEYSTTEIEDYLKANSIIYSTFKTDKEMMDTTAKLIAEDNVIGWFQGRMEWGPRALGSRSILSNASNPDMKEILNLKVKHREKFRPFAPVVTVEDANDWFEMKRDEVPYMLFIFPVRKEKRKIIPSVTHVDGSGRMQTISKEQNPRYYGVIKAFEKITKVPVLINTSFNIRGEPIVCTPHDAYRCMMGTGIDYLVMDRFLIKRDDNPKDMWDSEALATD
ncbi:hypothetical protein AUJ68_05520 [Candidatus Woesearchaeota archaeon CG1_02_57_44]|nr:MAG: hypothetical protein AUJ68_05520 [Candidatus Woesearchaeota archaeon CG1_02_57_44]